MRLLHCKPNEPNDPFISSLEEFQSLAPKYSILSHCWGKVDEEVSFRDMEDGTANQRGPGFEKLMRSFEQTLKDGNEYIWIDTCCIDKRSSAELSEAINSMYSWYEGSSVCYAYLHDVEKQKSMSDYAKKYSAFRSSKWFRRGWTLQELIAPRKVVFYAKDWSKIGTKLDMADLVAEITNIDVGVLRNDAGQSDISVAKRMSWAASRQTTRVEDIAYSLMGLFGVNMPTLYGEGSNAFFRLQEEIMRTTYDHSLFAWKMRRSQLEAGLLASSPQQFSNSTDVVSVDYNRYALRYRIKEPKPEYTPTNYGTRIQLPLEKIRNFSDYYRAYLACTTLGQSSPNAWKPFPIILKKYSGAAVDCYRRIYSSLEVPKDDHTIRSVRVEEIYIWNPPPSLLRTKQPADSLATIAFTIIPAYEAPVPIKFLILRSECYFGAATKQFDDRFFKVDFPTAEDDNFIIVDLRFKYETTDNSPQSWPGRCFMAVGFHDLQIWTDIMPTSFEDSRSAVDIYNLYMDPTIHPGNARLMLRSSTTKPASNVSQEKGNREAAHSISVGREIAGGVVYHRTWIKAGL